MIIKIPTCYYIILSGQTRSFPSELLASSHNERTQDVKNAVLPFVLQTEGEWTDRSQIYLENQ